MENNMQTMNAAANPAMANDMINQILASTDSEEAIIEDAIISAPVDDTVSLLSGYIVPPGEVITEAEVRELTGRDEEAISKSVSLAKTLQMILQRGTVRIGDEKVTDAILDDLLSGDRDWLLLNIYAATFGRELTLTPFCTACDARVEASIDILSDIPIKEMDSPFDRRFEVECGVGKVKIEVPSGKTQRAMMAAGEKSGAELSTILLKGCIIEIKGMPILRDAQVLDLSIKDRRTIAQAILDRNPGPQLQDVKVDCPTCSSSLEVPLTMAALFQF